MSSKIIYKSYSSFVSRFCVASAKLGEFWMMLGSNGLGIMKIARSRLDKIATGQCKVILG
jgi:hypothetical protein